MRAFCEEIGVTKFNGLTEIVVLENAVRADLNKRVNRFMAVINPIKVIIDNYPEDLVEELDAVNNPEDPSAGTRLVPFSKELYIERDDFMEVAQKKYFRLAPGAFVRLKGAYIVKCDGCLKDEQGNITVVLCTYLPESRSGNDTSGLNVKGTIHWVSARHAATAKINMYDRLFKVEDPSSEEGNFKDYINPESLKVLPSVYVEPFLLQAKPGTVFQFLRKGYFCADIDSLPGAPIFNRTVTLKDNWVKESAKSEK
jgi:glutaminyl-tRNA synthetase